MGDLTLYNQHRGGLKTGDMLLWANNTILGRLIQYCSGAPVNHASTTAVLKGLDDPRVFTVEALQRGVMVNYLSAVLADYKGEVFWYPLADKWDFPEFRAYVERNMFKHIGTPYDVPSLLKNAVKHVQAKDDRLFCSEDVFLDYGFTGTAPTPGEMPSLGLHKAPVQIMKITPSEEIWHETR